MVKKISGVFLSVFIAVFMLLGCSDPYEGLTLKLTSEVMEGNQIVLYLDSAEEDLVNETNLVATVSGGADEVDRQVSFEKYSNTTETVDTEVVAVERTSFEGQDTVYKLTAKNPGRSTIVVSTLEGGLKQSVEVVVYKTLESIEFTSNPVAVEYGKTIDLNNYINFYPQDTNQTEVQFFIDDTSIGQGNVTDEFGRVTATSYAKIENGILTTLSGATYPQSATGQAIVNVYAVSKTYNGQNGQELIKTNPFALEVVSVIDNSNIELYFLDSDGKQINLQMVNGKYQIVLAENANSVYSKNLYIKLNTTIGNVQQFLVTEDKKYSYSTSYAGFTDQSIFDLTEVVSDSARLNYEGDSVNYPIKQFKIEQNKTGRQSFEIYIDYNKFLGEFTKTLQIEVIVNSYASELTVTDQYNQDLVTNNLAVYDIYGAGVLGTQVNVNLNPNPNLNYTFMPTLSDPSSKFVIVNQNGSVIDKPVAAGTPIYLSHTYTAAEVAALPNITDELYPKINFEYSYTLAPNGVTNADAYEQFSLTKTIAVVPVIGVRDLSVVYDEEIKINAVSAQIVNADPGEVGKNTLLHINQTQGVSLKNLISEVEVVSVNNQTSNLNALDNSFYSLNIEDTKLTITPKAQGQSAVIKLVVKTNNGIIKYLTLNIFVPIVYTSANADMLNVNIYDYPSVSQFIYTNINEVTGANDSAAETYYVGFNTGQLVATSDNSILTDSYLAYNTLNNIDVAVNSKIGFDIFNYVSFNGQITKVNYNANVRIISKSPYFSVAYVSNDAGDVVPYIYLSDSVINDDTLNIEFQVIGLNAVGEEVVFSKYVTLNIIEPVANIAITPALSKIYFLDSVGEHHTDKTSVTINAYSTPASASFDKNNVSYSILNEVVYSYNYVDANNQQVVVEILTADFVSLNKLTGEVDADMTAAIEKIKLHGLNEYEVISYIFNNGVVATVVATYKVDNKNDLLAEAKITVLNPTTVNDIILSVPKTGVYFDTRNGGDTQTITITTLPANAFNKTIRYSIDDPSLVQVVSGGANGIVTSGQIVVKSLGAAGSTSITFYAEDSYYKNELGEFAYNKYNQIEVRIADGSIAYPFEIYSANDFLKIGQDILNGNNSYNYVIADNISVNEQIVPFGSFAGSINGEFTYYNNNAQYKVQNYVYGLTINQAGINNEANEDNINYGLFTELGKTAQIKNLIIEDYSLNLAFNEGLAPTTTNQINVGGLAGVNHGLILNSSIKGEINVNDLSGLINIGGLVGYNNTEYRFNYTSDADYSGELNGVIKTDLSAEEQLTNTDVTSVVINYYYDNATETTKVPHIGGLVGLANATSYYNNTKFTGNDVLIYQFADGAAIENISVVSSIKTYAFSSTEQNYVPTVAIVGGAIGKLASTYVKDIFVITNIAGFSELGGLVGYSEYSVIDGGIVEFPNTGASNSLSIVGYTNIGGLAGTVKNTNIRNSYVRSYFGQEISDTYQGNIGLLNNIPTAVLNKDNYGSLLLDGNINVGGLIGRTLEFEAISNQAKSDDANFAKVYEKDGSNYVLTAMYNKSSETRTINPTAMFINPEYSTSIYKSYFNADINTSNHEAVFVGALIGSVDDRNEDSINVNKSVNISDSYAVTNIKIAEKASVTTAPEDNGSTGLIKVGKETHYRVVNNYLEQKVTIYGATQFTTQTNYFALPVNYVGTYFKNTQDIGLSVSKNNLSDGTSVTFDDSTHFVDLNALLNGKTSEDVKTILTFSATAPSLVNIETSYLQANGLSSVANADTYNLSTAEVVDNYTVDIDIYTITEKTPLAFNGVADLTTINSFAGFNIIQAASDVDYADYTWTIASGINYGYPVLLSSTRIGEILYKFLPTQIVANYVGLNETETSNNRYFVSNNQLVLLYNKPISGTTFNTNTYYFTTDTVDSNVNKLAPYTAINLDLGLVDISSLGLSGQFDKRVNVTSSNPNIIQINANGTITTHATGEVTLTFGSVLNQSITEQITVLVVTGFTDYNIYTKNNSVNSDDLLSTVVQEVVVVDELKNYYPKSINIDTADNYNGVYESNNNLGALIKVEDLTGALKINGTDVTLGGTYAFANLTQLDIKGISAGNATILITPIIVTNSAGFGETIVDSLGKTLNNVIMLNEFSNKFEFVIVNKAESVTLSKNQANIDPTGKTTVTVKTVTSSFVNNGTNENPNYVVEEIVYMEFYDITSGEKYLAKIDLENPTVNVDEVSGAENKLIVHSVSNMAIKSVDDYRIEISYDVTFGFNSELYKRVQNTDLYTLSDIGYKMVFTPSSNPALKPEFVLNIVPKEISNINAEYYPNKGTSTLVDPQETSSNTIVPNQTGLLRLDIFPELSNYDTVVVSVDPQYNSSVRFNQYAGNLTNQGSGQGSYLDGFTPITETSSPGSIELNNISYIYNGENIFEGVYFVEVYLLNSYPLNTDLEFIVTAYNENGTQVAYQTSLSLEVKHLPTLKLTTAEGLVKDNVVKGVRTELILEASDGVNLDDVTLDVSTASSDSLPHVKIIKENGKIYLDTTLNVLGGDVITVKASVAVSVNQIEQIVTSEINLTAIEYEITSAQVSGTGQFNGVTQIEVLAGSTTTLRVGFNINSAEDNSFAINEKTILESMARGATLVGGKTLNHWYSVEDNVVDKLQEGVYTNYEFIFNSTRIPNSFDIKAKTISDNNTLAFIMYYTYVNGLPQIVESYNAAQTLFELRVDFTVVIKDNSTYDNPIPIETIEQFMNLGGLDQFGNSVGGSQQGGHFILTNNLVVNNYVPFALSVDSLDGNSHTITVNSFNTTKYASQSSVNVGVFESIAQNTVLKNFTVDVGGLLSDSYKTTQPSYKIDLRNIANVTFGVIAGENNGSITNAKVISTKQATSQAEIEKSNLVVQTSLGYINGELVETQIATLVGQNNGVISNSYVGLYEETFGGNSSKESVITSNLNVSSLTDINTYPFNIVAANVAGVVYTNGAQNNNTAVVASTYNLGVGVINLAEIYSEARTAGFVVNNNGEIFNAYVEGLDTDSSPEKINENSYRASEDIKIEARGNAGGFVYENNGYIHDAYTNIYIDNNSGGVGGFVYLNNASGKIANAYSTVKSNLDNLAYSYFTGIDAYDRFNNFGTYDSCFYLLIDGESVNFEEPAIAIEVPPTGDAGTKDLTFENPTTFNGFNISETLNEKTWHTSKGMPKLSPLSSNTVSYRVLSNTTEDKTGGIKYEYDYVGTTFGSATNPLLINNGQEFVTFILNNTSAVNYQNTAGAVSTMYVFGNKDTQNTGEATTPVNIRLINNIDFKTEELNYLNTTYDTKYGVDVYLRDVVFNGVLDGNGLTLSGIEISTSSDKDNSYGLFSQIGMNSLDKFTLDGANYNQTIESVASVKNVKLEVLGVSATNTVYVGSLAGQVYNSNLNNIVATGTNALVAGKNLVGGIAGYVKNSEVYDVTVNGFSVTSNQSTFSSSVNDTTLINSQGQPYSSNAGSILNIDSYYTENIKHNVLSYAGGVFGVVDNNDRITQDNFGVRTENIGNADISNISVNAGGFVSGLYAGGLFGLLGEKTHAIDVNYTLGNTESGQDGVYEISAKMYGGAIVGENYAKIERATTKHYADVQADLENPLNTTAADYKSLFNSSSSNQVAVAIGGIAGYSNGGEIIDSYSKVSVYAPKVKIAGGMVGLLNGSNIIKYSYTTADVLAKHVTGGVVGLYAKTADTDTLQLETVFGLNNWGQAAEQVLTNKLSSFYADNNFELRLPEIGNQVGTINYNNVNYTKEEADTLLDDNPEKDEVIDLNLLFKNFNSDIAIGSLIGYVSVNSGQQQLNNYAYAYDANTSGIATSGKYNLVDNDFKSVVTSTFNTAKINNAFAEATNNLNNNTDFNQATNATTDKISFTNNLSMQLNQNNILSGTTYGNFMSMFILEKDGSSSQASEVWIMDGLYPRHIVGTETSFTEIENITDFANIKSTDPNKYYLVKNDLNFTDVTAAAVLSSFEGVLIGNGTKTITINVPNKTITVFNKVENALISNINFVINVNASKPEGLSDSFGFVANEVTNSAISSSNVTINTTLSELDFGKTSTNVGFIVGKGNNLNISGVNLNVTQSQGLNITNTKDNNKIGGAIGYMINGSIAGFNANYTSESASTTTTATVAGNSSFGGVVGYASGASIYTANNNVISTKNLFIEPINLVDQTSAVINIGGVVGFANNSRIDQVNYTGNIAIDGLTDNASTAENVEKINTLNFGGVVGSAQNTTLGQVNVNEYITSASGPTVSKVESKTLSVTNAQATKINFGGIIGFGNLVSVIGNNTLSTSNNSKISATLNGTTTESNIGGLFGLMQMQSSAGYGNAVANVYNAGEINVVHATAYNANQKVYVGGIAGKALGGSYNTVQNIADITVSNNPTNYRIGTIIGSAEHNTRYPQFKLQSFINHGNIKVSENPTSNKQLIGGVIGYITGTTSASIEEGYTLSQVFVGGKLATTSNFINGISYAAQAQNAFKNAFYVLEFMPYANLQAATQIAPNFSVNSSNIESVVNYKQYTYETKKDGETPEIDSITGDTIITKSDNYTEVNQNFAMGVSYGQLVSVLNGEHGLSNKFSKGSNTTAIEFVINNKSNLPTLSNLINPYENVSGFTGYQSGSKLNPNVITTSAKVLNNTFNIIDYNKLSDNATITLPNNFAGVVVGSTRDHSKTIILNVTGSGDIVLNGIIADMLIDVTDAKLFDTNNGSIVNVVLTGNVNVDSISSKTTVYGFVNTNNGNMVQVGNIVKYNLTDDVSDVEFASIAYTNNGFIKDAYSTAVVTFDNVLAAQSTAAKIGGITFDNQAGAVIDTSYYAGNTYFVTSPSFGASAIAYTNSGKVTNSFVDSEAIGTKDGTYFDLQYLPNSKEQGVNHFNTTDFINQNVKLGDEDAIGRSVVNSIAAYGETNFAMKDLGVNYGYPIIKNGIVPVSSGNTYEIYNAGQLNNLSQIIEGTFNNFSVIAPINMASVNMGTNKSSWAEGSDQTQGEFTNVIDLGDFKVFNGNNYQIDNLNISGSKQGLFDSGSTTTIKNISLKDGVINSTFTSRVGLLLGDFENANLSNINISGTSSVTAESANYVGGLAGYLSTSNAGSNGINIDSITVKGNAFVGGAVGSFEEGSLSNIIVKNSNVTAATGVVGGVFGYADADTIESVESINNTVTSNFVKAGGYNDLIWLQSGTQANSLNYDVDRYTSDNFNQNYNSILQNLSSVKNTIGEINASFAGGVVGYAKQITLTDIKTNVEEGGASTVTGENVVGGIIGFADQDATITISDGYSSTVNVVAKYNAGGLIGINNGRLSGTGSASKLTNASVGNTANKTNLIIGGAIGTNNGVVDNIDISNIEVYGSKFIGGFVGHTTATISSSSSVSSTNINYLSEIDMDGFAGDMGDDFLLGASNSNSDTRFEDFDFNNGLGLTSTDSSRDTYNKLYSVRTEEEGERYVMEYGGMEVKNIPETSNDTYIKGQEQFKLFVGFSTGVATSAANVSISVSNVEIKNIFDTYTNYVVTITKADQTNDLFGDWYTLEASIDISNYVGVRVFNISSNPTAESGVTASDTAQFKVGSNNYVKFDDTVYDEAYKDDMYSKEDRRWIGLNISDEKFTHLLYGFYEETNYSYVAYADSADNNLFQHYSSSVANLTGVLKNVSSGSNSEEATASKAIFASLYPGMEDIKDSLVKDGSALIKDGGDDAGSTTLSHTDGTGDFDFYNKYKFVNGMTNEVYITYLNQILGI